MTSQVFLVELNIIVLTLSLCCKPLKKYIDIYCTSACGVGSRIGEHKATGRNLSFNDLGWGVYPIFLSLLH